MNKDREDIAYTAKTHISCSGTDELTDHPTIYLEIDKNIRELACPYCNRLFKLTE
ncbi:MAG: Zinc-finger domain [Rickettsiaceae bacterium]|jgi:uncharacterized Zn-finger protein|nr:Zinc-finger domain [Rickettsiaceae bacterium]